MATSKNVAAHIRSCSFCNYGLVRLSKVLLKQDVLSCDQCREYFPNYYEATRPTYPLVEMAEQQITEVARHLSGCSSCHDEYEELVFLSRLEEQEEML